MKEIERALKAFADFNRLRIILLLKRKKMCVCELAAVLEVTQPSVSRHLKKLVDSGVVGKEQDGFWTNYFLMLTDERVRKLIEDVGSWTDGDAVVESDRKKAQKANRSKLCCR